MAILKVWAAHLTSNEVQREIKQALGVREMSDAAALTVASWYQSSGTAGRGLAALASGYPVDHQAVLDDIYQARRMDAGSRFDREALDMLGTWTLAKVREMRDRAGV